MSSEHGRARKLDSEDAQVYRALRLLSVRLGPFVLVAQTKRAIRCFRCGPKATTDSLQTVLGKVEFGNESEFTPGQPGADTGTE